MADLKISGLTALTAADTADLLEIVDVSDTTMAATGTNKKITAGQVLASGLPATFGATNVSTLSASGNVTVGPTGESITLSNASACFVSAYTGAAYKPLYIRGHTVYLGSNTQSAVGTISDTGLAVIGAVSASENIALTKNQNATTAITINNSDTSGPTARSSFTATSGTCVGVLTCIGTTAPGVYVGSTSAHDLNFTVSGVTKAVLSSTTFAVTGAITATTTGKVGTTLGVGNATPSASGAGITFPATVSASTDVNTLDDYDEYTAASAACTGAITTAAVWKLTKVGNNVTLTLPSVVGTATAVASFVFGTVIPAKYRPAYSLGMVARVYDNGAYPNDAGNIAINFSTGEITVNRSLSNLTAFTNGANSGVIATSVSWTI